MLKHDQEFYRRAQEIGKSGKPKKQVMEFVNEEFRENPNYPGYAISNMGRVYDDVNEKMIKPLNNRGYYDYNLRTGHARSHRLVADTFIPKPSPMFNIINHKNCDKHDNTVDNLEWCTQRYNIQYARDIGHLGKYTNMQLHQFCKLISEGYFPKQIADICGVPYDKNFSHIISGIKNKRNWTNISDQYDFSNAYSTVKFSDEMKHEICKRVAEGKDSHTIADELGIPYKRGDFDSLVGKVKHNKTWHNIVNQYDFAPKVEPKKRGFNRSSRNYSEEIVRNICQGMIEGKTAVQIAREIGLEQSPAYYALFSAIKSKSRWRSISKEYF